MTEAELEENVRQLCEELGILRFHVPRRATWGMTRGLPDDILIGRRGLLWRELKVSTSLSPEQRQVGYLLQAAGQNWAVWHPGHWHSGHIKTELEAIR